MLALFVAAEAREFAGVLKLVRSNPLNWGLQFASKADLNGMEAVLVADGPGMQLAGAAADVARRHVRPDVVVSTGFCGAVDPELETGEVLIATAVNDKENDKTYAARQPRDCDAAQTGCVVSVSRVANSVADKRDLFEAGARAVEMEAGAVAARAAIWGVPFYCIRAVLDTAADGFGIDFNRMRDEKGRFSRGRIVTAALARPWSGLPLLLKLDRNSRRAADSLGEFFANCRL